MKSVVMILSKLGWARSVMMVIRQVVMVVRIFVWMSSVVMGYSNHPSVKRAMMATI